MKKLYFLLLLAFSANAQIVTIPDTAFKSLLLAANASNTTAKNLAGNYFKIDANSDGQIQLAEAQQVKELFIYESDAVSLEGLSSFTNIENLYCEFSDVTSVDATALVKLKKFYFRYTPITTALISNLPDLQEISILTTSISELNLTGLPSLWNMEISENNLTSLNLQGVPSLQKLWCTNDDINGLDLSNMPVLKQVWCMYLNLQFLNIANSPALEMIQCDGNNIQDVNLTGHTNLKWFGANDNPLGSIDLTGVPNLTDLQLSETNISTLNLAPVPNLEYLSCMNNPLTSLDLTPVPNLKGLSCSDTSIAALDFSGHPNFVGLTMQNSPIQSVDVSMCPNILSMYLMNNPLLEIVNIKNGKIEDGEISLTNTPQLQYVCVDDAQITAIQNHLNSIGQSSVSVNSYCSFWPGGANNFIAGNVRFDNGNDGCSPTDNPVPFMRFNISGASGSGALYGGLDGHYQIGVIDGTHTMSPVLETPQYFNITPTTSSVTFPATASPYSKDYCVTANGVHNDLEITIIPVTVGVPGFTQKLLIKYNNKGNATLSGLISLDYLEDVLDFQSATQIPIDQVAGMLTWQYQDLHPFESRTITVVFELNTPTETPPLNSGDQLPYIATISPLENDEMPIDNIFKLDTTVVNSMDPNNKTCLEGNVVSPDIEGQYVHYLIRFENLGTFPAHNVVVRDSFNTSKFLIGSLVPVAGSHPFFTRFIAPDRYEFIFDGIDLPFDDANNDGFIAFKIKTRPPLAVGDTFSNTASIFFDFNAPIVTNTATTSVQLLATDDFSQHNFSLYPNPANSVVNIQSKDGNTVKSVRIFNLLGQLLFVESNSNQIENFDVSSLAIGTYIVELTGEKLKSKLKFIKN